MELSSNSLICKRIYFNVFVEKEYLNEENYINSFKIYYTKMLVRK